MSTRTTVLALLVAVASVFAGMAIQQNRQIYDKTAVPDTEEKSTRLTDMLVKDISGHYRPDFSLPDLHGVMRHINEWNGRVIIINFWATWCAPCRKEIPEFIALQSRYADKGLQVIGIALQKPEEVIGYVEELQMNYLILADELPVIKVTEDFGNAIGALPYTVIVDRQGIVVFVKPGTVTGTEVEEVISHLL